jgi:hypothetical protein
MLEVKREEDERRGAASTSTTAEVQPVRPVQATTLHNTAGRRGVPVTQVGIADDP